MAKKRSKYGSSGIAARPISSSSSTNAATPTRTTGQKRGRQFDDAISNAAGGWGGFTARVEKKESVSESLDSKFGFERITDGPPRLGWLLNMHPVCRIGRRQRDKQAVVQRY
jgi:hypothetical protein